MNFYLISPNNRPWLIITFIIFFTECRNTSNKILSNAILFMVNTEEKKSNLALLHQNKAYINSMANFMTMMLKRFCCCKCEKLQWYRNLDSSMWLINYAFDLRFPEETFARDILVCYGFRTKQIKKKLYISLHLTIIQLMFIFQIQRSIHATLPFRCQTLTHQESRKYSFFLNTISFIIIFPK